MDDAENAEDEYGDLEAEEDTTSEVSLPDGSLPDEDESIGDGSAGDEVVDRGPSDVYLDVPTLNIEEINLEVEDLSARVSLRAEVLDLLRLQVGADVELGRVQLDIKGVEAQAQLKVRLGNVAAIVNRVLTTIDRNPQILEQLTRGVGAAVQEVGTGARHAVGELGRGAGRAVEDVGRGVRETVGDVGDTAGDVAGGTARKRGPEEARAPEVSTRERRERKDSGTRSSRTVRRRTAHRRQVD
ncbi:hypothetical protein [Streptomyces lushanensis]|uniref:hypothetical protein n=1 Tax=Streptomyces lushanensis TaxID=1434255 RepID=UPI00099F4D78